MGNYPDPMLMLDKYGADAVRLYLMNSPAVRAEPLKFKEGELYEVVKDVFLTWYNVYRFFVENATRFEQTSGRSLTFDPEVVGSTDNVMDRWLLSRLQTCVKAVRTEFENYKLYVVLQSLCTLMAPVTPFLTEAMYQNLRNGMQDAEESVHYLRVVEANEKAVDLELERRVASMMHAVSLGRTARDLSKVSFKVPLRKMMVVHPDPQYLKDVSSLEYYVHKILNVKGLEFSAELNSFVKLSATPDNATLGKAFRSNAKHLRAAVTELSHDQVSQLQAEGSLEVQTAAGTFTLTTDHVSIECNFCGDSDRFAAVGPDNGLLVALDTLLDQKLVSEGHARNFVSRVQALRKEAHLEASDTVSVFCDVSEDSELATVVQEHSSYIETALRSKLMLGSPPAGAQAVACSTQEGRSQVAGTSFTLTLTK